VTVEVHCLAGVITPAAQSPVREKSVVLLRVGTEQLVRSERLMFFRAKDFGLEFFDRLTEPRLAWV
jgi:hypothetical protein